ncbi:MAG: DUF4386 domain-containing protein [Devosia sp.]
MSAETLSLTAFDFVAARDANKTRPASSSTKIAARLAGVFYLLVGIFGGFAVGFVEPKMYVAGDAALTAQTVLANEGLVRAGVVADLLNQVFFVALAITLYSVLKHVHRGAARAMVALVAVAAAIASLNAVFLFEGLQVVTNSTYVAAFGTLGMEALVLLLLDLQHYGLLAAQAFFGLWLAPLGYLVFKSGLFPKALGVILVVAASCYLIDLLAAFLAPELSTMIHSGVVIPCAVAEISMVLYLLVVGTRSPLTAAEPTLVDSTNDDGCA